VFHQIYWNGRQNYFGSVLPAGRSECVLSATDTKDHTHTLHRWMQIAASSSLAAAKTVPAHSLGQAGTILKGTEKAQSVQIKERPKTRKSRKPPKRKARVGKPATAQVQTEAEPSAKPVPDEKAPAASKTGQGEKLPGMFVVAFKAGTHQMTPEGEKTMAKMEAAAGNEPTKGIELHGFAGSAEPDATRLAERRAQMIAGLLINKDMVEPKRINIRPEVSEGDDAKKVEIRFLGKE
jgi:outer membrane protein OmpA-like peptidoglycan-associated protein